MPSEPNALIADLLRGIVRDLQRASRADMVSLFLYDEDGSLKAPELRDLLQDAVTTLVREVDAPVEQAA